MLTTILKLMQGQSCEGFEILPNLQANKSACQFHGSWEKTQNSWVRDDRLYYSQQKGVARVSMYLCGFPDFYFHRDGGWGVGQITRTQVADFVRRQEFRAQGWCTFWASNKCRQAAYKLVWLPMCLATDAAQFQAMEKPCSLAHSAKVYRDNQDPCGLPLQHVVLDVALNVFLKEQILYHIITFFF